MNERQELRHILIGELIRLSLPAAEAITQAKALEAYIMGEEPKADNDYAEAGNSDQASTQENTEDDCGCPACTIRRIVKLATDEPKESYKLGAARVYAVTRDGLKPIS